MPQDSGAAALALWRAYLASLGADGPYTLCSSLDEMCCYFCRAWQEEPHAADCLYVRAKALGDTTREAIPRGTCTAPCNADP